MTNYNRIFCSPDSRGHDLIIHLVGLKNTPKFQRKILKMYGPLPSETISDIEGTKKFQKFPFSKGHTNLKKCSEISECGFCTLSSLTLVKNRYASLAMLTFN
jgi:hypothetical protein